jgi:tRNA1(Val) A37 N6-methylase TrmN6
VGCDMSDEQIEKSTENIKHANLQNHINIVKEDINCKL